MYLDARDARNVPDRSYWAPEPIWYVEPLKSSTEKRDPSTFNDWFPKIGGSKAKGAKDDSNESGCARLLPLIFVTALVALTLDFQFL